MQLNAEDGGHRKFIMVQLPEVTDEKSEAYKAGYKNICEIGKERIRRAAKKIAEENPDAKFDGGFRVLKCDTSNMKDVYYRPDEYELSLFESLTDNIKETERRRTAVPGDAGPWCAAFQQNRRNSYRPVRRYSRWKIIS